MPAMYLCNVTGTGTRVDPNTFSIVATGVVRAAMIDDQLPGRKACVWADDVNASGAGVIQIAQGATNSSLLTALQTTNLPAARRTQVNTWLTAGGYTTLPAGTLSLFAALVAICVQVNPALDLQAFILS